MNNALQNAEGENFHYLILLKVKIALSFMKHFHSCNFMKYEFSVEFFVEFCEGAFSGISRINRWRTSSRPRANLINIITVHPQLAKLIGTAGTLDIGNIG